jgi:hypothetical protein
MLSRLLFFFLLIGCLSACSVLSDYPGNTESARAHFFSGHFDAALSEYRLGIEDHSLDRILYLLEAGTAAHQGKKYSESNALFEQAENLIETYEDRAKVSVSEQTENLGSLMLNDKTLPYEGLAFEKVLLSNYQALNYLLLGDIERALTVVRRAQRRQEEAYDQYEVELERDKNQAVPQEYQSFVGTIRSEYDKIATLPSAYVNDTSSVFQLANTFYLSGVLSELSGAADQARIYYQKTLESFPSFQYANPNGGSGNAVPHSGSIVVFFQCDVAPVKEERYIVVPTGGAGFQKIAWPVYGPSPLTISQLEMQVGETVAGSQVLTDMNSVALRYFIQHTRARIIRAALRITAKIASQKATEEAVRHSSGNDWAFLAGLTASAINSWTEQADLRSWLTLPRSFQALRLSLPAGEYPASFRLKSAYGGNANQLSLGKVVVEAGKIRVFVVRALGNQIYFDTYPKPRS